MDLRLTLSEQLRQALKASGFTSYRLSKMSGVSEATLSRFMVGRGLTMDSADRLGVALGLRIVANKSHRKSR